MHMPRPPPSTVTDSPFSRSSTQTPSKVSFILSPKSNPTTPPGAKFGHRRHRRSTYKYVCFENGAFHNVCPNCKADFKDANLKLLSLDCNCSLCEKCCRELVCKGDLTCPGCGKVTHVGDKGVAALTPNYALATLDTDLFSAHRDTVFVLDEIGALCPICLEAYGEEFVPCVLSCGHSMCTGCRKAVDTECPQCRKQLRSSWEAGDHVNRPLLDALRTIVSLKRTLTVPVADGA